MNYVPGSMINPHINLAGRNYHVLDIGIDQDNLPKVTHC